MRFSPKRILFGRAREDTGEDLPTPRVVKMQARRAAGISEAKQTLDYLPGPGEALHAIMTARLDMAAVLDVLLERLGRCDLARIATLGYNARNFRTMLDWIDTGKIGRLDLVASIFFRSHNGELWQHTVEEFRKRGQRAACVPSHAKVQCLTFRNGTHLVIEGSANLCSNGSAREQFALINDPALCHWHGLWIDALVSQHEGETKKARNEGKV